MLRHHLMPGVITFTIKVMTLSIKVITPFMAGYLYSSVFGLVFHIKGVDHVQQLCLFFLND